MSYYGNSRGYNDRERDRYDNRNRYDDRYRRDRDRQYGGYSSKAKHSGSFSDVNSIPVKPRFENGN